MIRVLLSALCSLQRRLSYLVTRRPEIWDCAPFKRTLVSLAFLLLVVPGSGICTDGNRAYAIYGFGTYSCGKYVEEKTHGGSGHYKTWFTGYVTAINNLDPGTYDILGNTDIDGVMLWLENYCRNNPLKPFATASKALVYELYPKKTTQAPK